MPIYIYNHTNKLTNIDCLLATKNSKVATALQTVFWEATKRAEGARTAECVNNSYNFGRRKGSCSQFVLM